MKASEANADPNASAPGEGAGGAKRGVKSALKLVLLVFIGLVLEWQVVSRSVVSFLAGVKPELAVRISPSDGIALGALAERRYLAADAERVAAEEKAKAGDTGQAIRIPEARLAEIGDLAKRALADLPLDARTLAVLGATSDAQGDKPKARALMTLAAKLTHQETIAELWLLDDALKTRSFDAAAIKADTVLRTKPNAMPLIAPVLARMAEDGEAAASVGRLLATAPPWRAQFFTEIAFNGSDPLTPMRLLVDLKKTSKPATNAEYGPYLRTLVTRKLYANAYYTWLQSLSDEQLESVGYVFNGGFEQEPSGSPFDWTINQGAGVSIEFIDGPDVFGTRALRVDLGHGRIEFGGVEETLSLAPGRYRLGMKLRGSLAGRRGLRWQITCLDAAIEPLAETPMFLGVARNWQDVAVAFEVPQSGCEAQRLALVLAARSASEQFVTGQIWYDEVKIERSASAQ